MRMADPSNSVDLDLASDLVCNLHGQTNVKNVNEARYKKLIQMTGKIDQVSCK